MIRIIQLLHIALWLIGSALLFSCSSELEELGATETPSYSKDTLGMTYSRAEGSDEEDDKADFKAWCDMTFYSTIDQTNQRAMVFDGYRVCFDDEISWYYNDVPGASDQILHYWNPLAVQYNFNAVSPYPDPKVTKLNKVSYSDYTLHIDDVSGNIPVDDAMAVDWLVASHCRYINSSHFLAVTDEDLLSYDAYTGDHWYINPVNYTDDVTLRFHHILSMLEFRFYKEDGTECGITSITVELTGGSNIATKGSYSTSTTSWSNLGTYASELYKAQNADITVLGWDSQKVTNPNKIATSAFKLLEIPQSMQGKAFSVTVTTADGRTFTGEFAFKTDWIGGKQYIHYFTLPKVTDEIILVNISVDDFQKGDAIEVEDPVINW